MDSAAVELNDLLCRRLSFPPEEIAADGETAAVASGSVQQDDMIFRRINWPPHEFAVGRNDDYIGRDLWTGPSVCIQPVTGSLAFGSSQRLGRCYLWRAAFPSRGIGSAEVPFILLLLVVSGDEPHKNTLLVKLTEMQSWSGESMIWSYSWFLHCVGMLYDQMAEVNSLNCTCIKMIRASVCFFSFLLLIQQFIGPRHSSDWFWHFLTVYMTLRDQELGIGGLHITDKADSFHRQIRWGKLNTFAPDSQDVRELWAVRPHVILVKMIYSLRSRRTFQGNLVLCGLYEFLRQNVADIHEGISEQVSGTVPTSAFLSDMTVMSSSGVMVSTLDVPVEQIQPLSAVVSSTDAGITATPFVVPPSPDIEQQCRQLQDFRTCRTPESRQPPLLCSLSAVSSTRMVPWKPPEFPSSSSSIAVSSLSAESRRVRRATPCCCRRRITVCFQVWMLHNRPLRAVVSRFKGQNTLLLCLHVWWSGLCYQPDPPVPPTGSVVRISTKLPKGSLTSASVRTLARYAQATRARRSTVSDGNPASGLLPHLIIQLFVNAGCWESFCLHSQRASHVWTRVTVPVHYNGMITLLWSDHGTCWWLVLCFEPFCTHMLSGCYGHKRVGLFTLVDRTL